ncbi:STAS domain-containing protein [Legionella israelensis]|nr:STAS domain-containing protein [Legionella israelensis]
MMNNPAYKLTTALTFETVVAVRENLFQHILSHHNNAICLDLSGVKHCDSAGLALLIDVKKFCQKHDRQLMLTGVSKETQSLAEFCGIHDLLI